MVKHIDLIQEAITGSPARNITPHVMCVLGSQSYGLSTPESDYDYGVIGTVPVTTDWDITPGPFKSGDSFSAHEPADTAIHELRKACFLAYKGNLSLHDFLWLPEYVYLSDLGEDLISLRESFLGWQSILRVSNGLMTQFAERSLKHRKAGRPEKEKKGYRHLKRIQESTETLFKTGIYNVRVKDPESVFAFAEDFSENDPELIFSFISNTTSTWDKETSKFVIPEVADKNKIQEFLYSAQAKLFSQI